MSSFLQSNREERFFCAVLLHVLLTPSASRDRALALINGASGGGLVTDDLECYVEVAALRDAWRLLGDPNKWTPQLYAARRDVLLGLLTVSCGYDGTADELDELWLSTRSSGAARRKASSSALAGGRCPHSKRRRSSAGR